MGYSVVTGLWKTLVNNLVVLGPALAGGVLEFIRLLPEGVSVQYGLYLGLVTYFLKNYLKNKDL